MSWGAVLPEDLPLEDLHAWLEAMQALGWTDVWAGEVAGRDAFAQLSACASLSTNLDLGAIVATTTRGPGLLAMGISSLAALAPGRVRVALGSSSPQVLAGWNDRPADLPYTRLEAVLAFLHEALRGERISRNFGPFSVEAFRLGSPPETQPRLLIAGLGPRSLQLAGEWADGVLLNWISIDDVASFRARLPAPYWLGSLVYYAPDEESRERARRLLVAYANVPAYAEHHRRLGRTSVLEPVWAAWQAGDRHTALAALPDSLLDEMVVSGTPQQCRRHLQGYLDAGLDGVMVHVLAPGTENLDALKRLGYVGEAGPG
jgi:probable F420-dependent oxidoreductase